jgi:protein SDA1
MAMLPNELPPPGPSRFPAKFGHTHVPALCGVRQDRGIIAAARSLLQLYRERMPELLHKKLRGKGADLSSRPAEFGTADVAEGVVGVDLLAAREARLAAKGVNVDPDAEKEWKVGASDDDSDDDDDDDDDGEGSSGDEDEDEEGEGDAKEEVDVLDGAEDSDDEAQAEEDDDDEEEEEDEEGSGEEESGEEGSSEDEDDEDDEIESEDELGSATGQGGKQSREGSARPGSAASSAASSKPRLDVTRLLTPKDFERIKRLRAQQKELSSLPAAKRRRAEAALLEEEEDEAVSELARRGAAIEGEAVDEMDIMGVQAKSRANREEKLASTLAGREDRVKFGSKQKKKSGGSSNLEKKKSHPYMMAKNSRNVRNKGKNRESKARKDKRQAKKQFRGRVRK